MRGAGLVDDIDGLVRQMPIIDIALGQFRRGPQRLPGVADLMVRLKAAFQPQQDLDRFLNGRLGHIDLLEAARQRAVFFKDAAIFLIGGRADTF